MNKIILMLGHQSKVGKDTLADELIKRAGFGKIAFADKLKRICSDLFFIPIDEFYDEKLKNEVVQRYSMTRRQILQRVGQAMFAVDKCVWANHAVEVLATLDLREPIVITDFRFPFEIDRIKSYAALHGYEVKPVKIHRERPYDFIGSNDPSELALLDYPWPYHIHNNGTIDELYENAMKIINS